jgi:hypothetical protein
MKQSGVVMLGYAMVPLLLSGAPGCHPDVDNSADTSASTEAFKATSPACVSARDACRAQAQPVIDAIKAACAPVAAACGIAPRQPADAGGVTVKPDASTLSCDDARAACKSQIADSKATLQAVGDTCAASIRSACTVNHATDGAVTGGVDPDAGAIPPPIGPTDAGSRDAAGGNSCKTAQQSCHQQLSDIRAMPPAECTAVQTACSGQVLFNVSDACKMAAAACQSALQSTVTSTLDSCGTAIAASCAKSLH